MKKSMKEQTLHEKAVRLCEGGSVTCNGVAVKAKIALNQDAPCFECEMDSICRMEMTDLCAECDGLTHQKHILVLTTLDNMRYNI